jgi:hypothetical protein
MSNLAAYFARILLGLRTMARARNLPNAAAATMLFAMEAYLIRAADRFARLHARWLAGRLRPSTPRTLPARPRRPRPERDPANPRLTRSRGWLRRALGPNSINHGTQIIHMLVRPDMPAFLAATPQAARILRPILHLLAIDLPAELALPPGPRARAGNPLGQVFPARSAPLQPRPHPQARHSSKNRLTPPRLRAPHLLRYRNSFPQRSESPKLPP